MKLRNSKTEHDLRIELKRSQLAQGERVGTNFVYDSSGNELTVATLRTALGSKKGMAFLAGSVQVADAP